MGGSTFKQAWMVLTEYCEQFQRWGGSNPLDVLAEPLRILLQTGFSFKIWIRLVISTITVDLTTQFIFFFLEFQVELLETYKYNVYTCNKLCKNWAFFQTQHKPHLGLPRTWIISPKAMLKDSLSWDFRGRATTCHECTVLVKKCSILKQAFLKDSNCTAMAKKPPNSSIS